MIPILDTHLHLLYPKAFTYPWCEQVPELDREFLIEDYQGLVAGHGVAGSIFMEVDVAEAEISSESKFFAESVRKSTNPLVGVIASCRPEHPDFKQQLEKTLNDQVCGLRRILHAQPDEVSQTALFRDNIRTLADHKLPFDMCFLERQLPHATELAQACQDNQFVLNHCGNPIIKDANFEAWKRDMYQLAGLPNVVCKISGILANCAHTGEANLVKLRPWLETTVEAFGCHRVIWGSDWPVCNLTKNLPDWLTMSREFVSQYSEDEQHAILHRNAESVYKVSLPD